MRFPQSPAPRYVYRACPASNFLFPTLTAPPPNRTILPARRRILPICLVRQNLVIRNRIRPRPPHLPKKQPLKPRLPLQHALLLVVHVKQVQFPRPSRKALAPTLEQPPHHRSSKRIEQERHAWPLRPPELRRIPANDTHRRQRPSRCPPRRRILPRNPRQRRMQLHPHHRLERHLRRQQHRPPHPRPQIHKRKLVDRRHRPAPPPAHHHRLKHRRRNPVVSRVVPVMPVPALQVPPGNQPAGP